MAINGITVCNDFGFKGSRNTH